MMNLALTVLLGLGTLCSAPLPNGWLSIRADSGSFEELMARAESERAQGRVEQAFGLHADAYGVLGAEQRVGLMGEIAVDNALEDYESFERVGRVVPSELSREVELLLGVAVADRERAQREDPGLVALAPRRWTDALIRLQISHSVAEPESVEPPPPDLVAPPSEPMTPEQSQPPRLRLATGALVAGVASVLAGGGLVAAGVVTRRRVDARSEHPNASPDDDAELQLYRSELESWKSRGRAISTTMVVSGSVLLVAGVVAGSWGGVTLAQHRGGGRLSLRPAMTPTQFGVAFRLGLGRKDN